MIDQSVSLPGVLYLVVSAQKAIPKGESPLLLEPCSNRCKPCIESNETRLHRGRMITIFPKSTFPILPLVIFLARPSSYQLHRLRDDLPLLSVPDKEVNMVRSHRIIQDTRPEPLLPLEKPLQPPSPISGKPQKELLLMASMGNVPHAARNVMPIRSGHPSNPP